MDMPYVVRRPELNLWEKLYLPSIVGGMWITLGHMAKMIFGRLFSQQSDGPRSLMDMSATGLLTMQYPEGTRTGERSRGPGKVCLMPAL
jgi:hypothetical protein